MLDNIISNFLPITLYPITSFDLFSRLIHYYWVIGDGVDTTTKSTDYTYDRIIIMDSAVNDLSGDSRVHRFDIEYRLTVDETTAVSDHYPVYADIWCGRDMSDKPRTEGIGRMLIVFATLRLA